MFKTFFIFNQISYNLIWPSQEWLHSFYFSLRISYSLVNLFHSSPISQTCLSTQFWKRKE